MSVSAEVTVIRENPLIFLKTHIKFLPHTTNRDIPSFVTNLTILPVFLWGAELPQMRKQKREQKTEERRQQRLARSCD